MSKLELTPKEKVQLKLRDDVLTSQVEVNLQSTDVVEEDQDSYQELHFLPDEEEELEQEISARKALSKQRAIDDDDEELSTKVNEVFKILFNSAVYMFGAINENARIIND